MCDPFNNHDDYYVYNHNKENFNETMPWDPIPLGVEDAIEREITRLKDSGFAEKERRETPMHQFPQRIKDQTTIRCAPQNNFQLECVKQLWNQRLEEEGILYMFGKNR